MADPALATTIRRLREERHLSREAVAHRAGISAGALARIELGQSSPGWNTVRHIAAALGMTITELVIVIEATESVGAECGERSPA
jgi:transcriptional regulator with XRE-family HTH domain